MESQQKTFRETEPKKENYEKQGNDQSLEWLAQRGLVPRGAKEGNQWYPETLE